MGLPVWPAAVPHLSASGWGIAPFNDVLATEMEGGNVRYRRRPGRLTKMEWGRVLEYDIFPTLRTFLETTLYSATSRFRMPVCIDGSTIETRTVQIQPDTVKWSDGGSGVNVSFTAWIFPASVMN